MNLPQYFKLGGPWMAQNSVGHPGMDLTLLCSDRQTDRQTDSLFTVQFMMNIYIYT